MGQREDLLTAAKKLLVEKGYHRTTARDIAAASGAHLGSIGYHYGSKDALMNDRHAGSPRRMGPHDRRGPAWPRPGGSTPHSDSR